MKAALKALAVLFVAIAGFLIYAILAAVTSEEGARVGVCVAYAATVVVLGYLAMRCGPTVEAGHRSPLRAARNSMTRPEPA